MISLILLWLIRGTTKDVEFLVEMDNIVVGFTNIIFLVQLYFYLTLQIIKIYNILIHLSVCCNQNDILLAEAMHHPSKGSAVPQHHLIAIYHILAIT